MNRLSRHLLVFLLAGFCLVHAHPNGTSKITIRLIEPDSLTVTVEVNHDDIFNVTHTTDILFHTLTPEADRLLREQISNYLLSRVKLNVDNRPFEKLKPIRWKPGGKGPDDGFLNDSAALWTGNDITTFGGVMPLPHQKLDVNTQLFAEFGIQPISEISLYWRDSLLVRKWLGLDRTLRLSISQDSLAAMLQRAEQPPEVRAARQESLVLRFITLGYLHILGYTRTVIFGFLPFIQFEGLDHILFVLGLFFFSIRMRPLLWQITAFTIAHSITLGLAMLGVFSLSARIVEPLIALSIAVVGLENIFFRQVKASRWLIVFGFGLIHGMGFASALRGLGLPQGKFWPVLASFNLGVELGQLTVVTTAFLLTRWFWHKPWYFKRVVVPVSSIISLIALYWVVQRVFAI